MSYAKLNDGVIEFAPKNKDGIMNYNLAEDLLLEEGYKPVIESDKPQNARLYKISYSEDENNICEQIDYLETQQEFEKRQLNTELQYMIENLEREINDIDIKRIRAVCEPEIKDETTGETWLDYYNSQIITLRGQIQQLKERMNNDITN